MEKKTILEKNRDEALLQAKVNLYYWILSFNATEWSKLDMAMINALEKDPAVIHRTGQIFKK